MGVRSARKPGTAPSGKALTTTICLFPWETASPDTELEPASRGFLQSGLGALRMETLIMPAWEAQGLLWGDVSPGNLSHQSFPVQEHLLPTCFPTTYGISPKCSLPVNSVPETTSPREVTHAPPVTRRQARCLHQFTTTTVSAKGVWGKENRDEISGKSETLF